MGFWSKLKEILKVAVDQAKVVQMIREGGSPQPGKLRELSKKAAKKK
jgi:hypothetical protein